jgi:hypothetical protein
MAAAPPAVPPNPPQVVTIPVSGTTGIGGLTITPPTFLEKWGVVFVSVGGAWMLGICIAMLWYYLGHLPAPPPQLAGVKPEDYRAILEGHKTATDQFRDSLNFAFDLMVTKTILPLLTLLLGYLFGSKKS